MEIGPISAICLTIVVAILVEGIIEYVKSIAKGIVDGVDGQVKTAVTQIASIVIGVVLCLLCSVDVFASLGITFAYPYVGMVLTGVFASRGSNYVSDLVKRIQNILSGQQNAPQLNK